MQGLGISQPFRKHAGIFEALMDSGIVVVATSNRAPWDLNNYGVHEAIFNRFKQRLLEACTPVCLETLDYRLVNSYLLTNPVAGRPHFSTGMWTYLEIHQCRLSESLSPSQCHSLPRSDIRTKLSMTGCWRRLNRFQLSGTPDRSQ